MLAYFSNVLEFGFEKRGIFTFISKLQKETLTLVPIFLKIYALELLALL